MEFRPATVDDADALAEMVLAGVAHWGHDINHPEAVAGLRADGLPDADFIRANHVEVLVDGDALVGFYSLARVDPDVVELVHMFLATDRIGTGCGRRLWERAVAHARGVASRMLIMSDPDAKGFYAAMGAELEHDVEVSPGFALGRMWFETGHATA